MNNTTEVQRDNRLNSTAELIFQEKAYRLNTTWGRWVQTNYPFELPDGRFIKVLKWAWNEQIIALEPVEFIQIRPPSVDSEDFGNYYFATLIK